MADVCLKLAERIADSAIRKGRELGLAPLTVAVLDAGGHLVVLKREDRSGILRPEIALGKAWGALGMGFNSRELAARAEALPQFFAAISAASGGRLVPAAGGLLVLDEQSNIVGAVGISGDISDNDELCGIAGIDAAGLAHR